MLNLWKNGAKKSSEEGGPLQESRCCRARGGQPSLFSPAKSYQQNAAWLQLQPELQCSFSSRLSWACITRPSHLLTLGYLIFPKFCFSRLFQLCGQTLLQKQMSASQICFREMYAYGKIFRFKQNCVVLTKLSRPLQNCVISYIYIYSLSNSGSSHSSASYLFLVVLLWLHSFPYEET